MHTKYITPIVLLLAACGGTSSLDPAGPPEFGKSPAIEAFQASRGIEVESASQQTALDTQTTTADHVSLAPAIEARRVIGVLAWGVDGYCQSWASAAGITLEWSSPESAPYTEVSAGAAAQAFASAALDAKNSLPPQAWDPDFDDYVSKFNDFEGHVPNVPAEWAELRAAMYKGSQSATYVIGVRAHAVTFHDVTTAIEPALMMLHQVEDSEFDSLVAAK